MSISALIRILEIGQTRCVWKYIRFVKIIVYLWVFILFLGSGGGDFGLRVIMSRKILLTYV